VPPVPRVWGPGMEASSQAYVAQHATPAEVEGEAQGSSDAG
jgi:hypothetical protein